MIATRQFVIEGGLSGRPTKCRYCWYCATKGHCHGNHFCLSICGVYIGATWRIRLNRLVCGGDAALCQITLTTCFTLLETDICLNWVVFTPFSGALGEWLEGIFGVYSNGWTAVESSHCRNKHHFPEECGSRSVKDEASGWFSSVWVIDSSLFIAVILTLQPSLLQVGQSPEKSAFGKIGVGFTNCLSDCRCLAIGVKHRRNSKHWFQPEKLTGWSCSVVIMMRLFLSSFLLSHLRYGDGAGDRRTLGLLPNPNALVASVLWHCWLGGRKGIRPV